MTFKIVEPYKKYASMPAFKNIADFKEVKVYDDNGKLIDATDLNEVIEYWLDSVYFQAV